MSSVTPPFTLSGYSTARYATWFHVAEAGLLMDAGDGLVAGLMSSGGTVKTIAVSHADRDHLSGLLHFVQLFGKPGTPQILYPESSGSFPALSDFSKAFDPQQPGSPTWTPMKAGMEFPLEGGLILKTLSNRHVPAEPGQTKSLSFVLLRRTRKLKAEYQGLPGHELAELKKLHGADFISDPLDHEELLYTADTPVEPASHWGKPKVMIHECTFLDKATAETKHQIARHAYLDAVLDVAAEVSPATLVLSHFSTRYTAEQIEQGIVKGATKRRLPFPIHAVLPGLVCRDLLRARPVYAPG
jgi:ribonuclease Z